MRVRPADEKGMSLVEATIILMVLAVLTAVLAPAAGDYINDARNTKAKEDVEAIGTAIARLTRDVGLPCLSDTPSPTTAACAKANRIDLLVGGGNEPVVTASTYAGGTNISEGTVAWAGETAEEINTQRGTMNDHFTTNVPTYTEVAFTTGGGPRSGLGWRGAYLSGPIDADPWGFMYQSNTVFMTIATDADAGTGEGQKSGGWSKDVIVVSSGSNGTMQTPFAGETNGGTIATGDDVVYVVKGASR